MDVNVLARYDQTRGGDAGILDVDKITETLEPEQASSGGLYVPGKDRLVFRPPERKSVLGALNYQI